MSEVNFLAETLQCMVKYDLKPADIVFIGSEATGHRCRWDEFEIIADVSYDPSVGSAEVAIDLMIVFQDGTRFERDIEDSGRERWWVNLPFKMPTETHPIFRLVTNADAGEFHENLAGLNGSL